MKRIIALVLALALAMTMAMPVFAADEIEIPLDADHLDLISADEATFADGSVTVNEINQFAFLLPEMVDMDQTVVIHIKGTSDGDFRAWLLGAGTSEEKGSAATFSNQWKASDNGFTAPAEFEKYIELTAEDFDSQGFTSANRVNFKAPSYDSTLVNFTLTYLGVIYAPMSEVEGNAADELQPFMDQSNAALEAANAATDDAGRQAALADAQAAADAIAEKATLGFPSVNELLKAANDNVKAINNAITNAASAAVMESIQSYIDTVNNALETAKAAGSDVAAVEAALAEAQTACDYVEGVANDNNYDSVTSASRELKLTVREIESVLEDSKKQKADEEAAAAKKAAEEEAAAKRRTTTIIIVVVVVVVVVVAVVVILGVLKKKKKK